MKKNRVITIVLVLILIIGLSLLLYPPLSDYWNSFHSSRLIAGYAEAVADTNDEAYSRILDEALAYNRKVALRGIQWFPDERQKAEYNKVLDITGTGIMGYIEIKKINCMLPIFHGVDDSVLQIAVGHIEGSSLPVGGETSHCILSGHRGLPSSKLFSELDRLKEGDLFALRVMDETLTYEVDQIRVVLPYELDELKLEPGHDYCTLVTCTPYGVNSHRLLLRGHRVENEAEAMTVRITGDALIYDPLVVAPALAVPILLILLLHLLIFGGRNNRKNQEPESKGMINETN